MRDCIVEDEISHGRNGSNSGSLASCLFYCHHGPRAEAAIIYTISAILTPKTTTISIITTYFNAFRR